MSIVDWGIVVIILISTLISIWRGAIREVISLTTWILAFLISFKFYLNLVPFYSAFTQEVILQKGAAFLTLMLLILIIGTIIGITLSAAVGKIGLRPLDRTLGMGFGGARGILIIAIAVMFAKNTELPSQAEWKHSQLLPHFDTLVGSVSQWLTSQGYDLTSSKPKTDNLSEL